MLEEISNYLKLQIEHLKNSDIQYIVSQHIKHLKSMSTPKFRKDRPCSGLAGGPIWDSINPKMRIVGPIDVIYENKNKVIIRYKTAKLDKNNRVMKYNIKNKDLTGNWEADRHILRDSTPSQADMVSIIEYDIEETIDKTDVKLLSIKRKKQDYESELKWYNVQKKKKDWYENRFGYNSKSIEDAMKGNDKPSTENARPASN